MSQAPLILYKLALDEVASILRESPAPLQGAIEGYRAPLMAPSSAFLPYAEPKWAYQQHSFHSLRFQVLDANVIKNAIEPYNRILYIFDQNEKQYPNDPWLLCMRGRLLWPLRYYRAAIQDFLKAYSITKLPLAALLAAESLFFVATSEEDIRGSIRQCNLVLERDSTRIRAYICRVQCYLLLAKLTDSAPTRARLFLHIRHDISRMQQCCPPDMRHVIDSVIEEMKIIGGFSS